MTGNALVSQTIMIISELSGFGYLPLRSKKAGRFEKLLGLTGIHPIVTRDSVSFSCTTTTPILLFEILTVALERKIFLSVLRKVKTDNFRDNRKYAKKLSIFLFSKFQTGAYTKWRPDEVILCLKFENCRKLTLITHSHGCVGWM